MKQAELERYCKDHGIPCHVVSEQLRVMDLTQLPGHMREQFDERGFIKATPTEQLAATVQASETEQAVKPLRGKLPEDFPGHAALEAEGLTTYAKVRKRIDSLQEVQGIGEATAEKIRLAMNESSEDEEEQDSE